MAFDLDTLDHVVVGRLTPADGDDLPLLGASGGLTADDARAWHRLATLTPRPARNTRDSQAVGLSYGDDGAFILSRTVALDGDPQRPLYQHIRIPREVLQVLSGNLALLVEMTEIVTEFPDDGILPPVKIPPAPTWTSDRRLALLEGLLAEYGGIDALLRVLSAALHPRGLTVRGYSPLLADRLNFVQGIMMLLPAPLRPDVTFSTYSATPPDGRVAILFDDDGVTDGRWLLDQTADAYPDGDDLYPPYVESLRAMWDDDLKTFAADLRAMELLAAHLMDGQNLSDGLNDLAERLRIDTAIMRRQSVPPEQLKAVVRDLHPMAEPLVIGYADRLLQLALDARDAEAVHLLFALMIRHSAIDEYVLETLENALGHEPDAVYFFVRTILADQMQERWLPVLHSAAIISMSIVIQEAGDAETVMTWIKLIANEPTAYGLQAILRDGILAARQLTHTDGVLGRRLLSFTSRRVSDIAPSLLADAELMAQMEEPFGPAFRDFAPEMVGTTIEAGREISLFLLEWALNAAPHNPAAAEVFSSAQIDYIWTLYVNEEFPHMPSAAQPLTLIHRLVDEGGGWLERDSVAALMKHSIRADDLDFFIQVSLTLVKRAELFGLLILVLERDDIAPNTIIDATQRLLDHDAITPQQTVDILLSVAAAHEWQGDIALRLTEQVARMFQQNAHLHTTFPLLEKMLILAESAKSDLIAKIVIRGALAEIEAVEEDAEQIALLGKVARHIQWSNSTRNQMIVWWRDYARAQPVARLQAWDKALDGKKPLEWARAVASTALAMRKMLGKRSLEEFADAVSNAYSMLQALSDSFDGKQNPHFDAATVRVELDTRGAELTPDERNILAKNLRELAELITELAENRSKSTLMRREEEIERQLLAGEQAPQSAIDTMRWLSGYLSGQQNDDKA